MKKENSLYNYVKSSLCFPHFFFLLPHFWAIYSVLSVNTYTFSSIRNKFVLRLELFDIGDGHGGRRLPRAAQRRRAPLLKVKPHHEQLIIYDSYRLTGSQSRRVTAMYVGKVSPIVSPKRCLFQGPHSNPIYKFPVFSLFFPVQLGIFPEAISEIFNNFICKTDFKKY